MEDNHCIRTIHAENNAIIAAAKNGVCIKGATAYVNWEPCFNFVKILMNAGIIKVKYKNYYEADETKRPTLSKFMCSGLQFANSTTRDLVFDVYRTHSLHFLEKI